MNIPYTERSFRSAEDLIDFFRLPSSMCAWKLNALGVFAESKRVSGTNVYITIEYNSQEFEIPGDLIRMIVNSGIKEIHIADDRLKSQLLHNGFRWQCDFELGCLIVRNHRRAVAQTP